MAKRRTKVEVRVNRNGVTMNGQYIDRFVAFLQDTPPPYATIYLIFNKLPYRQRQHQRCGLEYWTEEASKPFLRSRSWIMRLEYHVAASATTQDLFKMLVAYSGDISTMFQQMYDEREPQIGIAWAMPPAPPTPRVPKQPMTLVEKRALTATTMLKLWSKRLASAKKKCAHYRKKVRYYQKRGAAK